jgi:YfiH family protein
MRALSLTSPLLTEAGFLHGFSTRWASQEGEEGAFPSAADHLAGFFGALGRPVESALRVKQVHGAAVLTGPGEDFAAEADAIVLDCSSAQRTAVVRTADCVPILIADCLTGRVAAVHAGWRGVQQRIVRATLEVLAACPGDVRAAIGPCLCVRCFEVGEDVVEAIVPVSSPSVVERDLGPKPHVDLRRAVRAQLRAHGVEDTAIDDVAGCTRCEPERFFSYRRDGANAGRLMAAIVPSAPHGATIHRGAARS